MNAQSKTSMSLAIIDRRNNRIVSSEPVEDSHNPHILPSSDHERELRVLTMLENTASEDADHKLIPIDLKKLIRKVVIHPASAKDFRLEVRNELKAHGIPVHVAGSQLRVSDLQAMT